ncbi:MAG: outer membrane beta-barrel protein [Bacteroidales bacterium]|nr:outer membrane beta-barrel protein [Bacteroidales bacterium]
MRKILTLLFLMLSPVATAQDMFGELSLGASAGIPSFFTFNDNASSANPFNGNLQIGGEADFRLILSDSFSVQTGVWYFNFIYDHSSSSYSYTLYDLHFGTLMIPVSARFDFLKCLYANVGIIGAVQIGEAYRIKTDFLGAFAGLGVQYNFKSGIFIAAEGRTTALGLSNCLTIKQNPNSYGVITPGLCVKVGFRFLVKEDCGCIDSKQARNFRKY